jgi:hypothetical protein
MGVIENNIISLLERSPGLSDRELTDVIKGTGASPQYVNQYCRYLESQGILVRRKREDGLIGNWLNMENDAQKLSLRAEINKENEELSERKLKQILESYLISEGWETQIAWGFTHGIDIEARHGLNRWIIEVSESAPVNFLPSSSFTSALGKVLQRMEDSDCKYSVAFPDLEQYRRLWERLPHLAKSRMGVTALFVNKGGMVTESNLYGTV